MLFAADGKTPLIAPAPHTRKPAAVAVSPEHFSKDCPVDAATLKQWRHRLRQVSPHNDRLSYLHLVWEPGWYWEPIQRFLLVDCWPNTTTPDGRDVVAPAYLTALQGPDPSGLVECDPVTGERTINRWPDGSLPVVTGLQWRVYQETGRYSTPFWVIQGSRGGHKLFLTPVEIRMRKLRGLHADPPAPGDLPYAPFDNRVIDRIQEHDRLWQANGNVQQMSRLGRSAHRREEQKLRRELCDWLDGQLDEPAQELIHTLNKADAPRDPSQAVPATKIDADVAEYIETGKMSDVRDSYKPLT